MATLTNFLLRALPSCAATGLIALSLSCNDNSFSGSAGSTAKDPNSSPTSGTPGGGDPGSGTPGNGDPGNSSGNGDPGGSTGTGNPNDCVKGDLVNLAFTGPVKSCFDSGRTWNFGANKCQDIRKAKFECTWDNILSWFASTNVKISDKIQSGKRDGRKVVSCGESEDNNRLVVIWLDPPKSGTIECDNPKALEGLVVTGCYTFYPDPTKAPPDTTDATIKAQRVYACMDTL